MSEYLTKEEIRQWRSSLERITLEEFAARLGKVIQGEKQTNDMIDKVMTSSLESMQVDYKAPSEKISTISLRQTEHRANVIKQIPETQVKEVEEKHPEEKNIKEEVKAEEKPQKKVKTPAPKKEKAEQKPIVTEKSEVSLNTTEAVTEENITFKKPLIPREQLIFNLLLQHKGTIVYAKDMAALLELPRDYVYKYIKNLRQKINEEVLFNADNGGYVLKV